MENKKINFDAVSIDRVIKTIEHQAFLLIDSTTDCVPLSDEHKKSVVVSIKALLSVVSDWADNLYFFSTGEDLSKELPSK